MRDLDQSEIDSIFSNRCPACGSTTEGFYRGAEVGPVLNIYCANVDECGAGYTLMGAAPQVNLGGRLVKPSKLGDVRAAPPPEGAGAWLSYALLFTAVLLFAGTVAAAILLLVR